MEILKEYIDRGETAAAKEVTATDTSIPGLMTEKSEFSEQPSVAGDSVPWIGYNDPNDCSYLVYSRFYLQNEMLNVSAAGVYGIREKFCLCGSAAILY